jgi:hypothetical protein
MEEATVNLSRIIKDDADAPFAASETYELDGSGNWRGEFVVPVDAPPGTYVIGVTCWAGDMAVHGKDVDFAVLDRPPVQIALSTSALKPGESLVITLTGCVFEDGSPATSAKLTLVDANEAGVAASAVPVEPGGNASGSLTVPDRVTYPGSGQVLARCEGPQGSMVGRPASVVLGAATPVRPPRITLTG